MIFSKKMSKVRNTSEKFEDVKEAKVPKLDESQFLDGLDIFLHPAALSSTRRTIFERQIQLRGGTLLSDLKNCSKAVVIIDNQVSTL